VREVANYVRALEYELERLDSLPVSLGLYLYKELHKHLMEGVRGEWAAPGEFRNRQNWIGRPGCAQFEAIHPFSMEAGFDGNRHIELLVKVSYRRGLYFGAKKYAEMCRLNVHKEKGPVRANIGH